MNKLSLKEMYQLMLKYFDNKISKPYINSEEQEITVILYNSFIFKFGIDDRYDLFKGGIFLDNEHVINTFFGKKLSMDNNEQSIIENFTIVDNYCRLRLPDKYLNEYDKH